MIKKNNDQMSGKTFVRSFVIFVIIILISMMGIMYAVDPFLYYRDTNNKYWLDSMFVSSGLIKNYDYDTAIIGSSMFQNFKMDWFREKMGYKPVNLTMSGLDIEETEMLVQNVIREGKASRMIIALDMIQFNSTVSKGRYPEYLYDESVFNDYQYLLGYEAWLKFLPLDIAYNVGSKLFPSVVESYSSYTDKDVLGDRASTQKFGKDIVKNGYLSKNGSVSKQNVEGMRERMSSRLDEFIVNCDIENKNIEYIFVFPPYSALYWYNSQIEEYYDILIEFKKEIIEKFEKFDNVRLIDMQVVDEITDLDHYKDITHYDMYLQERIVDIIKDGSKDINLSNYEDFFEKMEKLLLQFKNDNEDWLNN